MGISHIALALIGFFVVTNGAAAQEPQEVLPNVAHHSEPLYPPLARQTRIQGDVRVRILTDGESVVEAEAEEGNPLLRPAALDNVKSWKFVVHTPGTFHVTFRYKLLSGDTDVEFLQSPALVEIAVCPPTLTIDWVWIGLGTWKAQLKSSHGQSWKVLKLYCSGPNTEWLKGDASGPNRERQEIDFGHKEGTFLAFTVKLTEPDGKQIKTFFVGKMTRVKIVGTFVDDAGITGEWAAVPVPKTRPPDKESPN